MRIGISSPIVVQHPSLRSEWEANATIDDLSKVATTADGLGFHHLTCSEHVAVPVDIANTRGGVYWDPLSTLSFLAARTTQIRLATNVIVIGYHHPLAIAKRYGTLDRLSGGRVILGVGVGSLEAEFKLLDAPFADRGNRADDAIKALRAAFSDPVPEYHGRYYDFDGFVSEPRAVQDAVPIWIGGHSRRSLRRAVELGDGWTPFGLSLEQMVSMIESVQIPQGFDLVLSVGKKLDPMAEGDAALRTLASLKGAGATVTNVSLVSDSVDHYCEQLNSLAEIGQQVGAL